MLRAENQGGNQGGNQARRRALVALGLVIAAIGAAAQTASDAVADAERRVEKSRGLLATGQISAATIELAVARRLAPESLEAQMAYQDVKRARGRDDELPPIYDEHLQKSPDDPVRQFLAARVRTRVQDRVNDLQAVVARSPSFYEARLDLARALIYAGQPREALVAFQAAAQLQPEAMAPIVGEGIALRLIGDVNAAEERFLFAKDLDPRSAIPYHQLALNLIQSQTPDQKRRVNVNNQLRAERLLMKAIEIDPLFFDAVSDLARHMFECRKKREARRLLLDYSAQQPKDPRPLVRLAEYDIADGLHEMAEEHLENILRLTPDEPLAMVNLAVIYSHDGRHKLAEERLREALEIHPRLGSAWVALGHVSMQMGKYSESIQAFETALAASGILSDEVWPNLARGHARLGRELRGKIAQLEAEKGAQSAIAELKSESDRHLQEARRYYQRALETQPDIGMLHMENGEVALALEDPTAALASFALARNAGAERPADAELDYVCACAWLIAGDLAKARGCVENILTVDQRHLGAIELRRQIDAASGSRR